MQILLHERDLLARKATLRERFQRIFPGAPFIGADITSRSGGSAAIAVHQGRTQSDYTTWRVRHDQTGLAISYFEVWQYAKIGKGGGSLHGPCLVLKKAYLHLYRSEREETEDGGKLFFFHCDPLVDHRYQAGPHLHAECAGDPWSKKHIPLCDGFNEIVLKDIDSLDAAFDRIVDMIGAEFLSLTAGGA